MKPSGLKVVVLAVLAAVPVWADDEDGPGRGVARISLINGDVSVRRGDSGDHIAAALNAPLVVADRIFTGPGSRAEVQFDYANMVRLSRDTEIRLAELEHKRYTLQLARGTVTYRILREYEPAEVELSTPSVSLRPIKRGEYRLTVHEDGTSEITVRDGEADVFTPKGSQRLREGRTMLVRGSASDPEFQLVSEIREDEWDRWNERRDRDLDRARSYHYVSRDIYGAEDLDGHGRWVWVPPYGYVWAPHVAAGWAPYRYGRWSWIDWYGWSWVSHDPWGWAPYHYGRWFWQTGYGWCWYPGAIYHRHYWRPALVSFFGFGVGGVRVGFGFGWGRVGWVPLAPYERYYPWYGHRYYGGYRNRAYIDNSVNIVNNVNITNVYRNARVNNAITAVDVDGFSRGRSGNVVRVADSELGRAGVVRGMMPLTPERESLRQSDREAPRSIRVSGDEGGRFFSRREVARVERVPFDEQRRTLEQVSRRSFAEASPRATEAGGGRTDERPVRAAAGAEQSPRAAERAEQNRGWRRVEEPARGVESRSERATETREGWRRFGDPSPMRTERATETGERRSEGRADVNGRTAGADRSGDSWRRFGEAGGRTEGRIEGRTAEGGEVRSEPRSERSDSWRRDWPARSEIRGEGRFDGDRSWRNNTEGSQRREERWGGGDSVRSSPPIVRERSFERPERQESPRMEAPRMERSERSFDRGSSRVEMPRMERGGGEMRRSESPRMEAPRMERGGGGTRGGDGGSRGGERGGRGR